MATCSVSSEEDLSPKKRLKFLCSYGGKILPRPFDGQLKYVGGETRFLTVPRSISFSELKQKVDSMFNGDSVIKYQLMPEELDALVSVTCDEDLRHMLEEHDRQPRSPTAGGGSSPRLRVFLFPSCASPSAAATLEQRYVDAINGIPIAPSTPKQRRSVFTLSSSTCTSPTSTMDASAWGFSGLPGGRGREGGMHRVHSSPNIGSLRSQTSSGGYRHQHHHHHHNHHLLQQQQHPPPFQKYGMHQGGSSGGGGSGQGRSGGTHSAAPARYEMCGGARPVAGYQQPGPQPMGPSYYYRPPAGGTRCSGCGRAGDGCGPCFFCNAAAFKQHALD